MADKFLPLINCPNCGSPNLTDYSQLELNILKEAGASTGGITCDTCNAVFIYHPATSLSESVGK